MSQLIQLNRVQAECWLLSFHCILVVLYIIMDLILPLKKTLSLILLFSNLASGFRLMKHENWSTGNLISAKSNLHYGRDYVKGHLWFSTIFLLKMCYLFISYCKT